MNTRNLLTGIVVGAIVSVLVRQLTQFGLNMGAWQWGGPRIGEALITGALIGAISQVVGQARGRR